MSIQSNIDYHAQALADRALSANDPKLVQSILGNLTKSIQDGAVKPYVGIPLVQSINQHLQGLAPQQTMAAVAAPAPQVPPQGSIGAGIMQQAQAETSPGITAAPSGLPAQMATGGIVAFEDGGEVESYDAGGYTGNQYTDPNYPNIISGYQAAYPAIKDKYRKGAPLTETDKNVLQFLQAHDAIPSSAESVLTAEPAMPAGLQQLVPPPAKPAAVKPAVATPTKEAAKPSAEAKPAKTKAAPAQEYTAQDAGISLQPVAAASVDSDTYLKGLMDKSASDREGLKKLILGDDAERAKDREQELWTTLLSAGFKMAGGTSPYAAANIGAAGEQAAQGIAQIKAHEDAAKQQRISQLVNLGLKGSELDTELAKVGISAKDAASNAAYRQAQINALPSEMELRRAQTLGIIKGDIPYKQAMAEYTKNRRGTSGTAGMGSVSSAVVQQELNALEGYRAQPASAPFFKQLPIDVQTAITKTDPKSGSYQRGMQEFNKYAEQYVQGRLNVMRAYGAKQPQIYSGLPE